MTAYCYFQKYFSYIVEVSFLVGGDRGVHKNTDDPVEYNQRYTSLFIYLLFCLIYLLTCIWGRSGRDHMVVGFTTNCAISAYHH